MHVLVVEDEPKVAGALRDGLSQAGYAVKLAATGDQGHELLLAERFDLAVLDLMLPGRCGLSILEELRARGSSLPVLVLTARDAIEDRVQGLDRGADDYLVKPFALSELLARVRALLRRGPPEAERLSVGDLKMDAAARKVTRAGVPLDLTPRELDILSCLLRAEGRAVSRETLSREVWNSASRATPLDNVIDVHMARLRRKVDAHAKAKLLHTIRGVGFALSVDEP